MPMNRAHMQTSKCIIRLSKTPARLLQKCAFHHKTSTTASEASPTPISCKRQRRRMAMLDSRHGETMQADRYRACDACSVDGLSVGAVVGGSIQPGRCGQGNAARAIRPGRCGPGDAARAMRPGRCGQDSSTRAVRPGHCGLGGTARATRAGSVGTSSSARRLEPARAAGRSSSGGSSRLEPPAV